ncbi:GIN domain-containing protein [Phenylobacterium sp.]|jgi:hypothetical protein|uniref:GIN domain-containing protein n=1 Tax=Phenylobacterium sp. TaxID=1871053 RepID=UPI003784348E
MRLAVSALIGTCALAAGGVAQAAEVKIRDAAARVTVIPESRSDILVEVVRANPDLPIRIRQERNVTLVDGRLGARIGGCRGEGGSARVHVRGHGQVPVAQLPQVVIRTPMDVKVEASGAVFGVVGRAASVDLAHGGCGDWTLANVRGDLKLNQAGSGDTLAGSAGSARIRLAGAGDVSLRAVASGLKLDLAGSGDIVAASASGPVDISLAGSGEVRIAGGRATALSASVAGSGDVVYEGEADSLRARVAGSGDIRVRRVRGEVARSVIGSGQVSVGR